MFTQKYFQWDLYSVDFTLGFQPYPIGRNYIHVGSMWWVCEGTSKNSVRWLNKISILFIYKQITVSITVTSGLSESFKGVLVRARMHAHPFTQQLALERLATFLILVFQEQ